MPGSHPRREPRGWAEAWQVLAASERGAAHDARGLPNQDAVAACEFGAAGAVVAVADGHGHRRHFRSERGAQLAVVAACQVVAEQLTWPAGGAGGEEAGGAGGEQAWGTRGEQAGAARLRGAVVPALVARWRDEVAADVAAAPFTAAEQRLRWPGDAPLTAYGTTLLLAVARQGWLLLAQIGDGDIVGICADGGALLAVPGDDLLDGQRTTSLCSDYAEALFRVAAVETGPAGLLGVLLATDGYGNAQAAEPWAHAAAADLARLIGEQPREWLAGRLPAWARECASAEGSGDDTTIALLLAPRPGGPRPSPATGPR